MKIYHLKQFAYNCKMIGVAIVKCMYNLLNKHMLYVSIRVMPRKYRI